jgi:hypothetical protein
VTELSEALARGERVDGLSLAEQAAAEASLHLSTCLLTGEG